MSLLLVTLFLSYVLKRTRIQNVHESVVSLILGMIAGLSIRLGAASEIQKMVTFDHRYFFNLLLPPIIVYSGYDINMVQVNFD